MPLDLPEDLKTPLVVCGLSGKRYTGVREFHEILKPLVTPGQVTVVPKDGLCSPEAINRYVKWAKATFFIRLEAPDEVRFTKGWRAEFGPEDFVRDDHWTETALDDWDGWDAVIYNDGDEETLLAHANELAPRINALVKNPDLSKHAPIPDDQLPKTEHTTAIPECMIPGWGVNPPKKNAQGEYEFDATPVAKPKEGETEQHVKQSEARPGNPALQAAVARAATAASRWDAGAAAQAGSDGTVAMTSELRDSNAAAGAEAVPIASSQQDGQLEDAYDGRGWGWSSWDPGASSHARWEDAGRSWQWDHWRSSWSGSGWGWSGGAWGENSWSGRSS